MIEAMVGKVLLLFFGQICTASSVIAIKASHLDSGYLAASRVFVAALFLLPFFFAELKTNALFSQIRSMQTLTIRIKKAFLFFLPSLVPGILLGLHFNTWNLGARATLSANATLIVNLIPLVMPIFVFFAFREKPKKTELLGTFLGLLGLLLITFEQVNFRGSNFYGDLICFVSMLLFGAYLLFARINKAQGLWIYLVPLYLVSGLSSFIVNLFFSSPFEQAWSWIEFLLILFLALFPTLVGHNTMNWAMRHFPPQVVSLITVTQFVWAGIFAYFLFGETPSQNFYFAAGLVLIACLIVLGPGIKRQKSKISISTVETPRKTP